MKSVRSPLFYVGDKYKLMPQLKKLFPVNIRNFYDVFAGGGSVSLNTVAHKYYLNDLNKKVIELHKYLYSQLQDRPKFLSHEYKLTNYYGLTRSAQDIVPNNFNIIKTKYKKTYYSKINKNGYLKLRADFNKDQHRMDLMYLLLIYGFNHMTRFNSNGNFNLPVGNVDWNNNVELALKNYAIFARISDASFTSEDFSTFVSNHKYQTNDFLYFDPPYLISSSEYNKNWREKDDQRLFNVLDNLHAKWGLSDVIHYRGKTNYQLKKWSTKYNIYNIKSNYISYFDDTQKKGTQEVYITNYKRKGL